ncbi:hypothetical protein [Lactiplantibacillus fabifermentans]|uniref:Integral membrane protein n=2 Tax=Lactiplantibacillus fabifermentans TaxID=483011 RepID=A0A0R2NNZ9_9LACO|nr:hypothetical protein [Lactiplantibacillus fabifermentans]ETY74386.1 hypothetical protein LFAB_07355 [Lactiplantibacillus fabifermentans T30PCM01]KRO27423.1 hypothetical protein DY78_GL000066 [Lactiplantibacillus fabifermentans DSM 21115]
MLLQLDLVTKAIISTCFLEIVAALAHWSGLAAGHGAAIVIAIIGVVVLGLVGINVMRMAHQPRITQVVRQQMRWLNLIAIFIVIFAQW